MCVRIVSEEAKIYRFREHHMWMLNRDEYYSSTTTKYLTFDLPYALEIRNKTRDLDRATLIGALAIGQVLNRTVILPKFHCHNGTVVKLCPLNDLVMLTNFDAAFGNKYREHTFLTHPKVPELVKQSLSPVYRIDAYRAPSFKRISTAAEGSYDNPKVVRPANIRTGANSDEILQWFGAVTERILRFHSLYGAFSSFKDAKEHEQFFVKVIAGITPGNYRQYTYSNRLLREFVVF